MVLLKELAKHIVMSFRIYMKADTIEEAIMFLTFQNFILQSSK